MRRGAEQRLRGWGRAQCGLARRGESSDSLVSRRRCQSCPKGRRRPPTLGSQVRAPYPCTGSPLPGTGLLGVCLRLGGEEGTGRGYPVLRAGRVLPLLGQGAQLGLWLPADTAGPTRPPSLPPSQHGRPGASPGDGPQRHPALPGAHCCSRLLSPSSPVCVLCRRAQVNPDICGETFANGGLCAHQFCLVSSLKG